MNPFHHPYHFISGNIKKILSELSSFIRIPSVSAETKHKNDVLNCAKWLASHLASIGLENTKLIATKKHPIVSADWMHANNQPTLLIYGHYDVQPVDPLTEWNDLPFSGIIKNGYIYGRGSSDDKGQLFTHVKALHYFLQTKNKLPVNIKCIFEGEEEIGSQGLQNFIRQDPGFFRSDVAVVSDMAIPSVTQPAITFSLRGVVSLELEITGQRSDLHSGTFGGAVYNPAQALCEIIATFHDTDGRIRIPGFYKDVLKKTNAERAYMKFNNRSDNQIMKDAGTICRSGDKRYSLYENITSLPSISINGITAGYQGEGPKAIIPSRASAKISFRLAPYQDPVYIEMLFRKYVMSITPACLNCTIKKNASAKPVLINPANHFIKAAARAYEKVFRNKIVFQASGGTIPIVNLLQENLSIPVVLMGFALPDDNPHGPNEKFSLLSFQKGIATSIAFIEEIGNMYKEPHTLS